MLRSTSTYQVATVATIQLDDRRAMPTVNPMTVARTMPSAATRSVLSRPTQKACP